MTNPKDDPSTFHLDADAEGPEYEHARRIRDALRHAPYASGLAEMVEGGVTPARVAMLVEHVADILRERAEFEREQAIAIIGLRDRLDLPHRAPPRVLDDARKRLRAELIRTGDVPLEEAEAGEAANLDGLLDRAIEHLEAGGRKDVANEVKRERDRRAQRRSAVCGELVIGLHGDRCALDRGHGGRHVAQWQLDLSSEYAAKGESTTSTYCGAEIDADRLPPSVPPGHAMSRCTLELGHAGPHGRRMR